MAAGVLEMYQHVATIQSTISQNFQRSFSQTDKTQSDVTSSLEYALKRTRQTSLVGPSREASFNRYHFAVMSAARDPDKIWDGNHTVDNLLADKSSFYLASLQYQTQTSTSRVTPIPEEEGRSTGHEDFPLVPGLERDNRAATWPQNKPE